uniref:Uncharacterized protein n=1 Tax=Anguilla anguilla TaxID=7936 RepID=A0A0E9XNP1_ANGAN
MLAYACCISFQTSLKFQKFE